VRKSYRGVASAAPVGAGSIAHPLRGRSGSAAAARDGLAAGAEATNVPEPTRDVKYPSATRRS